MKKGCPCVQWINPWAPNAQEAKSQLYQLSGCKEIDHQLKEHVDLNKAENAWKPGLKMSMAGENPEDQESEAGVKERLKFDLNEGKKKSRRRSIANMKFIGELFKQQMLIEFTIHEFMGSLLRNNNEEQSLECLCMLLTTVVKNGSILEPCGEVGHGAKDDFANLLHAAGCQRIAAVLVTRPSSPAAEAIALQSSEGPSPQSLTSSLVLPEEAAAVEVGLPSPATVPITSTPETSEDSSTLSLSMPLVLIEEVPAVEAGPLSPVAEAIAPAPESSEEPSSQSLSMSPVLPEEIPAVEAGPSSPAVEAIAKAPESLDEFSFLISTSSVQPEKAASVEVSPSSLAAGPFAPESSEESSLQSLSVSPVLPEEVPAVEVGPSSQAAEAFAPETSEEPSPQSLFMSPVQPEEVPAVEAGPSSPEAEAITPATENSEELSSGCISTSLVQPEGAAELEAGLSSPAVGLFASESSE
ncbi:calphotin-like [Myxocyprinus asiaticus]|uniref:calphotin-like n=1 Tax=Myxocyprinus asiaticus TaxID=70543 RepID=UPI002222EEE8|nr:calphotin-like [Myxocyprinus asiaticus]